MSNMMLLLNGIPISGLSNNETIIRKADETFEKSAGDSVVPNRFFNEVATSSKDLEEIICSEFTTLIVADLGEFANIQEMDRRLKETSRFKNTNNICCVNDSMSSWPI